MVSMAYTVKNSGYIHNILKATDTFLADPLRLTFSTILLAIPYYLISLGDGRLTDIINAVFLSGFTIWYYRSSRKYGFVNTTEFMAVLPFALTAICISFFESKSNTAAASKKTVSVGTADLIAVKIRGLICGDLSCKIDHVDIRDTGFYVYLKIPFGIHPRYGEITGKLAHELHIPAHLIDWHENTPERVYFFFPDTAMDAYKEFHNRQHPWDSMSAIRDRLLLRTGSS